MKIRFASLLGAGLAALLGFALLGCRGGSKELRVLAWPGYADADWVAEFEQQCACRVQVVLAATDDDVWAKIQGSAGRDFDVFATNTAQLQRYIAANLLRPHDLARLPNQAQMLPRFRDLSRVRGVAREGEVYGIPFAFDAIGIIYDLDKVQPPPASLRALWDPRYKGKVLGYDNGEISVSIAAQALGLTHPFQLSDVELDAVREKLLALKANALGFYGTAEEALRLYRTHDVALIVADYGQQQVKLMREAGARIGYVNPAEGALAWLDTWAVTRAAREPALAESWVNHLLQERIGRELSERTGFGNTVVQSAGTAAEDQPLVWLEPVESSEERAALWNALKAQ